MFCHQDALAQSAMVAGKPKAQNAPGKPKKAQDALVRMIKKRSSAPMDAQAYYAKHEVVIEAGGTHTPCLSLAAAPFPTPLLELLKAQFEAPTPIQVAVWPLAAAHRDVLAIARTGSGKTLAFLLPAISRLTDVEAGTLDSVVKRSLWQGPSSAPPLPQAVPGGSGRRVTPRWRDLATGRPAAPGARASRLQSRLSLLPVATQAPLPGARADTRAGAAARARRLRLLRCAWPPRRRRVRRRAAARAGGGAARRRADLCSHVHVYAHVHALALYTAPQPCRAYGVRAPAAVPNA